MINRGIRLDALEIGAIGLHERMLDGDLGGGNKN